MSPGGLLVLVTLCLAWPCATRGWAQPSNPPSLGGPWYSRPKLTGDWCCLRERWRDNGYTFDISSTEYYQGTASGGLEQEFRFGGRNDYLVNVDGQKAGLWDGFL